MSARDLFGNPITSQSVSEDLETSSPSYSLFPDSLDNVGVEDEVQPKHRVWGMLGVLAIIIPTLAVQCFRLQVISASQNRAAAVGNSVRILTEPADRGLITDSNGTLLAQNDRRVALLINPQTLPKKRDERQKTYDALLSHNAITQDEVTFIEANREKNPEPYAINSNLSKEDSLLYREWFSDTPGVLLDEVPIRKYADIPSMGQLLGYVGSVSDKDVENGLALNQQVGKTGLEQQYNDYLSGEPGKVHAEVNADGTIIRAISDLQNTAAQTGQTLQLSLDAKLQQVVADALFHELERRTKVYGPQPKLGASAVVMDPTTGAIKAMVSLPDYSSNLFSRGITSGDYKSLVENPGNPLLNRAIQGRFQPGSTLKPLVAAAGLETGVITADTSFVTPDAITIGSFRFPDWKLHGLTNTRKAIAESNNIFFYAVGGGWADKGIEGLGVDTMNKFLKDFNLGAQTGIDLPGELAGVIPDNEWKEKTQGERWYIGDTYHSSIGQGFLLATPLQMANATAAIANGGTVWQPHLADKLINPTSGAETKIEPVVKNKDFVSAFNLKVVREGMRQAVTDGSARLLNGLKVSSAGKTGTAQFGTQGLTHAWYTGFAPYENPQIAFSIIIEGGGESFYSSVPVAEEILRGYFNEPLAPGQNLLSVPSNDKLSQLGAEFGGER